MSGSSVSIIQPISQLPISNLDSHKNITKDTNINISYSEINKNTIETPINTHPVNSAVNYSQNNNLYQSNPTIIEDVFLSTDISPAIAISDNELAYFHITKFTFRSHKSLTSNDIEYIANYISSFYSYSNDNIELDPNSQNILTDDQLIMILSYSNQNSIGKFALSFNEELDRAIKNRDNVSLKKLILGPKEMFVEVYDNPSLSTEDMEFIIRLISREMFSLTLALGLIKKKILNLETIDDKCTYESITIEAEKNDESVNLAILTTKCYDEVCIQDSRILQDDEVRASMSKYENLPESIYTFDKPANSSTPQTYCFNTIELIDAISNENPINPKTNQPFSEPALNIIRQRFNKEINMYHRYKQLKLLNQ